MDMLDGYLTAWLAYLVAALILCFVGWKISARWSWRRVKMFLRMLMIVVLFTPINISSNGAWFAPAYLVGGYEWLLGNTELSTQAFFNLTVALAVGISLLLLNAVVKKLTHLNES
ncbi:MAG: hypothetical protein H7A00_09180 [Hahellaceae bacterium]|nr:hypothetical protein [Hahellaceae bacterium]